MKHLHRFCILLGLTFIGLSTQSDVVAQAHWVPKSVSLNVPSAFIHRDWSQCEQNTHDSTWEINSNVSIGLFGSLTDYQRVGDSIFTAWGAGLAIINISFHLDSVNGALRNFSIGYQGHDYGDGMIRNYITLSSVSFVLSDDSLLVADQGGNVLKNKIAKVGYYGTTFGNCNTRLAHYGTDDTFDHILDDSSKYQCSITLVNPPPPDAVAESSPAQQTLKANVELPMRIIHFTFPRSDHSLAMVIYDILGREVIHTQISGGRDTWDAPSLGSGTYFARLGNLSTSFLYP